jgi:hypothetical protein
MFVESGLVEFDRLETILRREAAVLLLIRVHFQQTHIDGIVVHKEHDDLIDQRSRRGHFRRLWRKYCVDNRLQRNVIKCCRT